ENEGEERCESALHGGVRFYPESNLASFEAVRHRPLGVARVERRARYPGLKLATRIPYIARKVEPGVHCVRPGRRRFACPATCRRGRTAARAPRARRGQA